MDQKNETIVINLFDDRVLTYDLPPDKAVVAAYEQSQGNSLTGQEYWSPEKHPYFKEYCRGFACGDWVALKYPAECLNS